MSEALSSALNMLYPHPALKAGVRPPAAAAAAKAAAPLATAD
ncbi:MAG: hypothetical protein ABIR98_12765 [Usitatibacter sp.]